MGGDLVFSFTTSCIMEYLSAMCFALELNEGTLSYRKQAFLFIFLFLLQPINWGSRAHKYRHVRPRLARNN